MQTQTQNLSKVNFTIIKKSQGLYYITYHNLNNGINYVGYTNNSSLIDDFNNMDFDEDINTLKTLKNICCPNYCNNCGRIISNKEPYCADCI